MENSGTLAAALREQGEDEDSIRSLAPAVERLMEWPAAEPSRAETQRLLLALAPLLPAPAPPARPGALPVLTPVGADLRRRWLRRSLRTECAWFLEIAQAQRMLLRVSFWLASAVIAVLGVLVGAAGLPGYQVTVLRAVGPLLAVLAVRAAFRSARLNVLELELSCPPSPFRVTLARLVLVLGYDAGLGLLMSLLLVLTNGPGSGRGGESLLALTMHWLAPLLLVAGAALLVSLRWPTEIAAALSYAGWLCLLAFTVNEPPAGFFHALLSGGEVVLAILGLGMLGTGLARLHAAAPALLPHDSAT